MPEPGLIALARYRLTIPAAQDIADILDYVASTSGEDRAADVAGTLHSGFERLATYPHSGRNRPEFGPGIRSTALQSWMIYYRPASGTAQVDILRILHAARDQMAALAEADDDSA